MSGDKLPPGWVTLLDGGVRGPQGMADTAEGAWAKAVEQARRILGQTCAEYEQRERALACLRKVAGLMDGEVEDLEALLYEVRYTIAEGLGERETSAGGCG